MFNAERVEVGWGGGAEEKSGERAGGLRWDKEGVPLQRPSQRGRKGGEGEGTFNEMKRARGRERETGFEQKEHRAERGTETRRKTEMEREYCS